MAVDTAAGTVFLLKWEAANNTPIGEFLRELTRGGKRRFTCDDHWIEVQHLHSGSTFTLEFGEETV
jgi:hypothetical protein